MFNEAEVKSWAEMLEKAKENRSRDKGKLQALMQRLKEEFEHESLDDLKKDIEATELELEAAKKTYLEKVDDFREKYLERLQAAARRS